MYFQFDCMILIVCNIQNCMNRNGVCQSVAVLKKKFNLKCMLRGDLCMCLCMYVQRANVVCVLSAHRRISSSQCC